MLFRALLDADVTLLNSEIWSVENKQTSIRTEKNAIVRSIETSALIKEYYKRKFYTSLLLDHNVIRQYSLSVAL